MESICFHFYLIEYRALVNSLYIISESIDTTQMAVMGNVIEISILSKSYELAEDCVHSIPLLSSFEKVRFPNFEQHD